MSKKQTRIKLIIIPAFFVLVFFFASEAKAATYYMREGGTAVGKSTATGPCTNAAATMSLATHNKQVFSPGDIIIVCDDGGKFSSTDFIPPSSGSVIGTTPNYITYKAGIDEKPVFYGTKYGVTLDNGQDVLKFKRLKFQRNSRWARIGYTSRNDWIWFDECIFYDSISSYSGMLIFAGDYGKITNCTFPDAPLIPSMSLKPPDGLDKCDQYADIVYDADPLDDDLRTSMNGCWSTECQAIWEAGGTFTTPTSYYCHSQTAPADAIQGKLSGMDCDYWIIEGNTFGSFSHATINPQDGFQHYVMRNNVNNNRFHGNKGGGEIYNTPTERPYGLIEKNIAKNGGVDKLKNPDYRDRRQKNGTGIYTNGNYIILRLNELVGNDYGIYLMVNSDVYSNNQRIYHNTLINNKVAVLQSGNSVRDYDGNVFKNNLIASDSNYKYRSLTSDFPDEYVIPWRNSSDCSLSVCGSTPLNIIDNNMFFPAGQQLYYFKNTKTSPKTLATLLSDPVCSLEWTASNFEATNGDIVVSTLPNAFDLKLVNGAQAIDNAAYLTKVTAVNGNVIKVADSNYFYDGFGIPGEVGDTIYDDDGTSAVIQSIDYTNHNITLNNATGFTVSDSITVIDWEGSAPDIGAHEHAGSTPAYILGDLNKDGKVDIADYSMFIQDFGKTGTNLPADLNKNGQVEIGDYSIFISNFGKTS